jgi:hypothetical protein
VYNGGGNQQGTLGIATATVNSGNNTFIASVAIHEAAHDFGCTDDGQVAQQWGDFCVPIDPQHVPPPPAPCPNM